MKNTKHPFHKNWTDLRAEVSQFITQNKWAETDFRALSPHENWQGIERKIRDTFCRPKSYQTTFYPLWTDLKLDTHGVSNLPQRPESLLPALISANEIVWLLLNETVKEADKLWLYEGKMNIIQKVIANIGFSEIYIVSKKYEWLLCITHHDTLIATGKYLPDKLRKLVPQQT